MIKKFFLTISRFGDSPRIPLELRKKIRLTNQLAFFIALMAVPFAVICYKEYTEITIIPVIAVFLGPAIMMLNKYKRIFLSRVILSLAFLILVSMLHAYIVPRHNSSLTGMFIIQFALAMIPLLVFGLREYAYIIPTTLISLLTLFFFESYNDWLSLPYDDTFMRSGAGHTISVIAGIVIGFFNILTISFLNRKTLDNVEEALELSLQKNQNLRELQVELEATLKKVEQARIEEEKRSWQNKGMARFSNLLRENGENTTELDSALSFVIKYMDAAMGAIYLVEREGKKISINLESCYAWERKKYLNISLEPGEGLVGQCYNENEYIHLREIPEDYVKIRSGGLEIPPRTLLIVPMKLNGKVEGFIEIVSINHYEDYHITLMEQLGESLAVSLSTERANAQTRKLLEKSQESSEALRSQEEELRQNMEELAATQEEMERRNAERERIMKAAEAEIAQLKKALEDKS